ncbi:MFS transporter [Salinispira pacifica]|uniref:Permeases of the major facilitator superfamily n=1 Tax=Salinispira pacifica TaxID=1307761 RepID=V5WK24_9SPIO|nr:MFS transporter [Salinispira pacifica]AHC15516.1 Permeases of the major facilitator superfamily [Salinispira pacifica]
MIILLSYIAFISLGMPDGLHGVAWPGIRESFGLPLDAIGLILVSGTAGYMLSSFFSGPLMRRLGVGMLLSLSCGATAVSLILYSLLPVWILFAAAAVLGGLGAGAIDAGLNTYIAKNYGEHLMQWLHASFGIGVTLGPVIMTMTIEAAGGTEGSWRGGYAIVGIAQLILALGFFLSRRAWSRTPAVPGSEISRGVQNGETRENPSATGESRLLAADEHGGLGELAARDVESGSGRGDEPMGTEISHPGGSTSHGHTDGEAGSLETLRNLPSLLSMLMFFIYTGVELGLGLWSYSLLTESRAVDPAVAGFITGSYWAMFTLGRILGGVYARKLSTALLLVFSILLAGMGVLLLWLNISPALSVAGIGITGFAIAPIFPGLVSDTRKRVGRRFEANTIGMQIAAAGFGGAIMPWIAGLVAGNLGLESIPLYLFVSLAVLFTVFIITRFHMHREI